MRLNILPTSSARVRRQPFTSPLHLIWSARHLHHLAAGDRRPSSTAHAAFPCRVGQALFIRARDLRVYAMHARARSKGRYATSSLAGLHGGLQLGTYSGHTRRGQGQPQPSRA